MSKRKGPRPPRTSEIKSVMRAPPGADDELEAATEGEVDSAGDDGPNGPKADVDLAVEDGPANPEVTETAVETAVASDDGPAPERPRRLRPVRTRETRVTPAGGNGTHASDGSVVEIPTSADAGATEAAGSNGADDHDAVARWSDDGGPVGEDERLGGEDDDSAPDQDDGERFSAVIPPDAAEGDDTESFLRGLMEALLFTSQKPLDLKDLARSAGVDKPRARELLGQLIGSYAGRGICVEEVAGGFVMRSSPRYAPYIHKILALRPVRLSRAQLETLAIVAYRQPVTKPEVDDIRGVDSGQVIKGLLERSLLKMLGKKDEPGRPTLYGTTTDFLELLNLQSLKDLPTLREYTELSEESQRKFLEETGEAAPSETFTFERPPMPPASDSPEGSDGLAADEAPIESDRAVPEPTSGSDTPEIADDESANAANGEDAAADDIDGVPGDDPVTARSEDDDDDAPESAEVEAHPTSAASEDDDATVGTSTDLDEESGEDDDESDDDEESDDDDDDESDDDDDDESDDDDDDESDDDDDDESDDDDDDESDDDDDDESDDDDDDDDDDESDDDDVATSANLAADDSDIDDGSPSAADDAKPAVAASEDDDESDDDAPESSDFDATPTSELVNERGSTEDEESEAN